MADLSFRFSRALAKGRANKGVPKTRAEILRALLLKRAEAHRRGLGDREQKLRDQIHWSLPIEKGQKIPEPEEAD